MKRILLYLIALVFLYSSIHAQTLFSLDFEQTPEGVYTMDQFQQDWNNPEWEWGISNGMASVIDEGGNHIMQVEFPANRYGLNGTGGLWQTSLNGSYDEVYLSYRFKFEEGFEWRWGGKIPSLSGGHLYQAGVPPTGSDGWYAGIMWRGQHNYEERLLNYVAHPDQPGGYAEEVNFYDEDGIHTRPVAGQWHTITSRVVINTPGQNDGIIQAWLDGKMVLDRRDFRFRDVADFAIDDLDFDCFMGGNTQDWAPSQTQHLYFDDFYVSTQPPNLPQAPAIKKIGDYSTVENHSMQILISASDNQGDPISFSLSSAPAFASITNNGDGTAIVNFSPSTGDQGIYEITVHASDGNQASESVFTFRVFDPNTNATLYRINTGYSIDEIVNGVQWYADQSFLGYSEIYYNGVDIGNTTSDFIYYTERWGNFSYELPVPTGLYQLKLYFTELVHYSPNLRIMSVDIENGMAGLQDYDIFDDVGVRNASIQTFDNLQINDGMLNIDFTSSVDEAKISAIEVIRLPSGNVAPAFQLSPNLIEVNENFTNLQTVTITPTPVPNDEQGQTVTYSISPASVSFAQVVLDAENLQILIAPVQDQTGTQVFTITADDGQTENNIATQTFTLAVLPNDPGGGVGASRVRINTGGNAYTTQSGNTFVADTYFSGSNLTYSVNNEIAGTNDDILYQSERYGANFSYHIPVNNGIYDVVLHFSENTWQADGIRVFDVNIEGGATEMNDLDLYATTGFENAFTQTFSNFFVEDGFMDIDFVSSIENAKIAAIEVIGSNTPFPIELIFFDAIPKTEQGLVELNWATASETGNHYFTIERSIDGMLFEPMQEVLSGGNSVSVQTYRANDLEPINGKSYYRLKQTDLDGTFTYSSIVVINYSPENQEFLNIYPVPIDRGNPLNMVFSIAEEGVATISLFDVQSKKILERTYPVSVGRQNMKLSLDHLPPGYYVLNLHTQSNQHIRKIILK